MQFNHLTIPLLSYTIISIIHRDMRIIQRFCQVSGFLCFAADPSVYWSLSFMLMLTSLPLTALRGSSFVGVSRVRFDDCHVSLKHLLPCQLITVFWNDLSKVGSVTRLWLELLLQYSTPSLHTHSVNE
jgi:hypothetical protein